MDKYTEVIGFNGDIAREVMKQINDADAEDLPTIIAAMDAGEEQAACADSTDAMVEYGGEEHRFVGDYVVVINDGLGYVTIYRDEEAMAAKVSA